jgi:16S rRNA (guanine966-N2)-methyltransferase
MRIIAGKWRSRKLDWPEGGVTRPMPDRVRESLFSVLGSRYGTPGELPPLHVADVFAGSGSMGLEALSRGAASCLFFERDRGALAVLRGNLARLEVGEAGEVIARDAWSAAVPAIGAPGFDLVFLDPPYRDAADTSADGPIRRYLKRLAPHAQPGTLVVLHHPRRQSLDPAEEGWQIEEQREYGTHAVSLIIR